MAHQNKPRLAIVGVGDFYRMLAPGIEMAFDTVVRIDKSDFEPRPGGLRDHIRSFSPDAVMILTPNFVHADHVEEVAALMLPTFVEKPLVTTDRDLDRILESVIINPALYCSDFYVDIWGAPLLMWKGHKTWPCLDPWIDITAPQSKEWQYGLESIGEIIAVEATLLEGTGPASSFAGREWLWDQTHGGVLWDMGYHHLAMWFSVIKEPLEVLSVQRTTVAHAPVNASETFGAVEMRSSSGIKFSLKVGKYVETGDDRAFRIIGTKGNVFMDFVEPSRLVWNGDTGNPMAQLVGSRLNLVAAGFRDYVDSVPTTPYGLEAGIHSVRTMLDIRKH